MATMTLCNTVFMLMLLAALSACHGNAFGAWSGKQRQINKLAIYSSWPWISNCWEWDSNSGFSGLEPRALNTRPRRLGANRELTNRRLLRRRRREITWMGYCAGATGYFKITEVVSVEATTAGGHIWRRREVVSLFWSFLRYIRLCFVQFIPKRTRKWLKSFF